MTDELEPCPNPWCDRPGSARVAPLYEAFRVFCECSMAGPTCATEAEAITAWNTRADDTLITEARAIIEQIEPAHGWPPNLADRERRFERAQQWLAQTPTAPEMHADLARLRAENERLREQFETIKQVCADCVRINLVGKTPDATLAGTLRTVLHHTRAALDGAA